ncbi:hypothetical protein GCM10009634_85900 [Saccharothrix xinjiangensis]
MIRCPLILVNGSGNREFDAVDPGNDTGQSAPSSSTAMTPTSPADTPAGPVFATATIAPAAASAVVASTTTVERILKRPELIIRALL